MDGRLGCGCGRGPAEVSRVPKSYDRAANFDRLLGSSGGRRPTTVAAAAAGRCLGRLLAGGQGRHRLGPGGG